MTDQPLSAAAQAVLNAAHDGANAVLFDIGDDSPVPMCAAAALRAAADQAQASAHHASPSTDWGKGWEEGVRDAAKGLLAIAAELEGAR